MRDAEPRAGPRSPRRRSGGSGLLLALATASLLVAGCAAGKQAQTAQEQSTIDGTNATTGSLSLLDITIAYPSAGRYARGDDARLDLVISNNDPVTPDELVDVRTGAARRVTVTPTAIGTTVTASPHGPTSLVWPALTERLSGNSASGTGLVKRRTATVTGVTIPPDSAVSFRGSRPSIALTGLTSALWPGMVVPITFVFAKAGTVTANVPIAVPATEIPPPPTLEPSSIPGAGRG